MKFSPKYLLASSGAFEINLSNGGYIPHDPRSLRVKEDFKDAVMTSRARGTYDMNTIDDNHLVTVCGMIYPTEMMDGRLVIKGASEPLFKSGDRAVGLIGFTKLGYPIKKRRITNIAKGDGTVKLYRRIEFAFDEPIGAGFLNFMGYIIPEKDTYFYRTSDRTFVLHIELLSFVEKVYELEKYIDIFGKLGVETADTDTKAVLLSNLLSDETMINALIMENTFFVDLGDVNITYNHLPLEHSSVPFEYRTEHEPVYPLIAGRGKIIEYKAFNYRTQKNHVHTQDSWYDRLTDSYNATNLHNLTAGRRRVGDTYYLRSAAFLKIDIEKK